MSIGVEINSNKTIRKENW